MVDENEEQGPVRIPIAVDTTPRTSSLDKDALLKNCFVEGSLSGVAYVVKRPGLLVGTEAITTGANRGIFVNPQNVGTTIVWYINSSGTLTSVDI